MKACLTPDDYRQLAGQLMPVVQQAGRMQMELFCQPMEVETKADDSPVTIADRAAEVLIVEALAKLAPGVPVIAEEAASIGNIPSLGERFFLVDPLDGTKEFIANSREFTINIALVERGQPVFGMVFAPAFGELFLTMAPDLAVRADLDPLGARVALKDLDLVTIKTRKTGKQGPELLVSKSHMCAETSRYLEQFKSASTRAMGSSLKFCQLARGKADLYPRFTPTKEWDTAAGHSVLVAAGGQVLTVDGPPLSYGKSDNNFLNPSFIASGGRSPLESLGVLV